MYIGFNLKKADDLVENVCKEFNNMGVYTKAQWEPLRNTLRKEWVGPDEQSFEKKFVERVNNLYVSAYNLAKSCTETLGDLSDQWVKFQQKNTIDGSNAKGFDPTVSNIISNIFSWPTKLKKDTSIIDFKSIGSVDQNTNRGLQNSNSKVKIQTAVNTFVKSIQNKTNALFEAIQVNKAFYGSQTTAIKKYIVATGDSIADILTAVKDMNDALDKLASSSYTNANSSISSSYKTAQTKMSSNVNAQLGKSRWV